MYFASILLTFLILVSGCNPMGSTSSGGAAPSGLGSLNPGSVGDSVAPNTIGAGMAGGENDQPAGSDTANQPQGYLGASVDPSDIWECAPEDMKDGKCISGKTAPTNSNDSLPQTAGDVLKTHQAVTISGLPSRACPSGPGTRLIVIENGLPDSDESAIAGAESILEEIIHRLARMNDDKIFPASFRDYCQKLNDRGQVVGDFPEKITGFSFYFPRPATAEITAEKTFYPSKDALMADLQSAVNESAAAFLYRNDVEGAIRVPGKK